MADVSVLYPKWQPQLMAAIKFRGTAFFRRPRRQQHDWLSCDLLTKKFLGLRTLGVPLAELLGCQEVD